MGESEKREIRVIGRVVRAILITKVVISFVLWVSSLAYGCYFLFQTEWWKSLVSFAASQAFGGIFDRLSKELGSDWKRSH